MTEVSDSLALYLHNLLSHLLFVLVDRREEELALGIGKAQQRRVERRSLGRRPTVFPANSRFLHVQDDLWREVEGPFVLIYFMVGEMSSRSDKETMMEWKRWSCF
jgi:hypothetical protein